MLNVSFFAFSLFNLLIGFCVFMIQLWYREWKEHYLQICYNIASNFKLDEQFLPCWLRVHKEKRKFSADNFLLLITFLINIGIFFYSSYLLWNLIKCSFISKIIVIIFCLILYLSLLIIAKQKLINKQNFLIAWDLQKLRITVSRVA